MKKFHYSVAWLNLFYSVAAFGVFLFTYSEVMFVWSIVNFLCAVLSYSLYKDC